MKFNKNSRNAILSILLGDGYLSKSGSCSVLHSEKQLDYLKWKRNFLIKNGVECGEIKYKNNNGFPAYTLYVNVTRWGKLLRKILYPSGVKNISQRKLLDRLTPEHIAIWYMDDGSLSNRKGSDGNIKSSVLTLCTCTTRENNQIIIDYFKEVWGISFGQRKMNNSYVLICGTREARKFIKIVEKYVSQIPSMAYKLNVKP